MSRVNVYCCGGTGLNIGAELLKFAGLKEEGFAQIETYLVDTSRSNIRGHVPDDHVYIFGSGEDSKVDGAGKRRDTHAALIKQYAPEVLHKFKPADLNIVIHSTSGGTGAPCGHVIVKHLIERDQPVVVIMVGAVSSGQEISNTLKTFDSYERISVDNGKPIVSVYYENAADKSRKSVNENVQATVMALAAIFSNENHGLDSEDLKNFLNYTRVSKYPPMLAALEFSKNKVSEITGCSVVSVLTLAEEHGDDQPGILVPYHSVGYVSNACRDKLQQGTPLHATIFAGYYNSIVSRLAKQDKAVQEQHKTYVHKSIASVVASSEVEEW